MFIEREVSKFSFNKFRSLVDIPGTSDFLFNAKIFVC